MGGRIVGLKDNKNKLKDVMSRARKSCEPVTKGNLVRKMSCYQDDMLFFGELKSDAEYQVDRAKVNLEFVEADADKRIRKKSSEGKKLSEKQISAMIDADKKVVNAKKKLINAKWRLNTVSTVVFSLNKGGDVLNGLSYLWTKQQDSWKFSNFSKSVDKKMKEKKNGKKRKK